MWINKARVTGSMYSKGLKIMSDQLIKSLRATVTTSIRLLTKIPAGKFRIPSTTKKINDVVVTLNRARIALPVITDPAETMINDAAIKVIHVSEK